jgi:hypothetical protein
MKSSRKAGLSHYNHSSKKEWEGYRQDDMFWNDEHELALADGTLKLWEDPQCENCGWAFPPGEIWQEKRYIYCSRWDSQKEIDYKCKCWSRPGHVSCKPPSWCDKNRNRLTQEEIHNNHKPDAVRKRLTLSDEQRIIKKIRKLQDQHISISANTCSKLERPISSKERNRLYREAIAAMRQLDSQIEALRRSID